MYVDSSPRNHDSQGDRECATYTAYSFGPVPQTPERMRESAQEAGGSAISSLKVMTMTHGAVDSRVRVGMPAGQVIFACGHQVMP